MYGPVFWGLALASTNSVDLAQILEDLKLFHLDIGQLASLICCRYLRLVEMVSFSCGNDPSRQWQIVHNVVYLGLHSIQCSFTSAISRLDNPVHNKRGQL